MGILDCATLGFGGTHEITTCSEVRAKVTSLYSHEFKLTAPEMPNTTGFYSFTVTVAASVFPSL